MSLISIFVCGESKEVSSILVEKDFAGLISKENFTSVDFSGGLFQAYLIEEDFDQLLHAMKMHQSVTCNSFKEFYKEIIWGEDGQEAEFQGIVLKNDLAKQLSILSDEAIVDFCEKWNQTRAKEKEEQLEKNRFERAGKSLKNEMVFWAIPVAILVGMLTGSYSLTTKLTASILVVLLFGGLRYFFSRMLGSKKPSEAGEGQSEYIDWHDRLNELKKLCQQALKQNQSVIYVWSL